RRAGGREKNRRRRPRGDRSGGESNPGMSIDLVCMGEPMLEFNEQPTGADGRRLYLEGYGGDTSNAAIAAARQGTRAAYVTAVGRDPAGERFMELWRRE